MWNAGYPELEAEYEIQLAFSLSRKNVFFSVSAVAFSVECLIFLYRLYAESIVTAWRSDPPLVFSVLLLLLLL